ALCRTRDGVILAGTPEGLVRVRFEDEVFISEPVALGQAPSTNVLLLKPVEDRVLIGTDRGAGVLEAATVTWYKPEPGSIITGVTAGAEMSGAVWFGGSVGLMKVQGDKLVLEEREAQQKHGWVQALTGLEKSHLIGGSKGLSQRSATEDQVLMSDIWVNSLYLTAGLMNIPDAVPDRRPELDQIDKVAQVLAEMGERGGWSDELREYNEMTTWFQNPANFNHPDWERRGMEMFNRLSQIPEVAMQIKPIRLPLLKGLWIGTQENGLLLWSNDGKQRHFTLDNSPLPSNRITAIDGLENGETWIGTQDAGLARYRSQTVNPSQAAQTVYEGPATVLKILGDRLMLGTEREGLRVYDPVSLELLARYDSSAVAGFHWRVTGVELDPKGALWVSGDRGVWRFDGAKWQTFDARHGLATDVVRLLEVDSDGRVFAVCGTEGMPSEQLYQFDGTKFVSYGKKTVRTILGRQGQERTTGLAFLGLQKTYLRNFDLNNASVSLGLYDQEKSSDLIAGLLATPYFLLLGHANGTLSIFDGEGFKPVSENGP
ncbi:MAG TPA: hypothetical protein PKO06_20445, partial [Candidatus Ozemobacteraceae bacterium]|nr:hypothetical protein [Candidatus Ozemobacteraceae bacterium]